MCFLQAFYSICEYSNILRGNNSNLKNNVILAAPGVKLYAMPLIIPEVRKLDFADRTLLG